MTRNAVIFDIDGTLTNSTSAIIRSWNRYLSSLDCPVHLLDEELAGSLMGKTMDEWAMAVLPGMPLSKARPITVTLEQIENDEIRANGTGLYPFVKETFESLNQNYDLFILSNCGKGYIEAVMDYAGITPYVKGHLCNGDTGLDKPDNMRKMIEDYHMHCPVYVGDTARDEECCREVGIPFIYVSWGFGDVPDAQYRADSMKELPDVIRSVYQ